MTLPLSGIYKITNTLNGKVYVGQSKNIYIRRREHFEALRRHRHENELMQKEYETDYRYFRWDVIEICSMENLNEREIFWIKEYNSLAPNGYNKGWQPYGRKHQCSEITGYKQHKYHKTS